MANMDAGAAVLLASDVIQLTEDNARLIQELRIAREMLSEVLDIAHQAIAYIAVRTM